MTSCIKDNGSMVKLRPNEVAVKLLKRESKGHYWGMHFMLIRSLSLL